MAIVSKDSRIFRVLATELFGKKPSHLSAILVNRGDDYVRRSFAGNLNYVFSEIRLHHRDTVLLQVMFRWISSLTMDFDFTTF